jgi:hypothetical protein
MTQGFNFFWPWLLQTFGPWGAILVILFALFLCLAWFITPLGLWLLYRKGCTLEHQLTELRDRTATLSRQQQVERLKRDRIRKKPSRRR